MTQAIQTIERRVNPHGVSEPIVAPYGTTGDQIVVQLPGVADIPRAKSLIRRRRSCSASSSRAGRRPDEKTLLPPHSGKVPADMEILPGVSGTRGDTTRVFYLVRKVAAITGIGSAQRQAQPSTSSTSRRSASR